MPERLTPETAAALAAELRAKGEKLVREGEALIAESEVVEGYAQGLKRLQSTGASHGGKKQGMVSAERLRVSKGRSQDDPLQTAANDAGYTLRSLAELLRGEGFRVSHQYLMQCRRGDSRIRRTLAERIQELTKHPDKRPKGFEATRKNWPADGWAKEPSE